MRYLILSLVIVFTSFFISAAFAEPVVQNNVTVQQNVSPGQCATTWKGMAGDAEMVDYSGAGEMTSASLPGIRMCSNCAFDSNSKSCVCQSCTDYYN